MKRVVLLNDLKESDIRPEDTYNEYKQLLSQDIPSYFSDPSLLIKIDCPGCSNNNSRVIFNKMGFDYHICDKCGSLFVSPRPSDAVLRSFYKNSNAGIFLRKTFLGSTLEARSEKVFSYRIQWIMGLVEEYVPNAKNFLDYATRYPTFLEELKNTGIFKTIISTLPECYEQNTLMPDNIKVINKSQFIEDSIDIYAAFEVIQKIFSPESFFNNVYNACRKGGLFIITTPTSSGFEYQVLGEYSPNIFPPDRLNLLSLEALTGLIERAGFEIIEVSTPGRLDVEIVKKVFEKNPDIPLDHFWKYLFRHRNEGALHSLQEYLQRYLLSSHVRIAAIKR